MKTYENIGEFVTRLKAVTNAMKRNGESLDDYVVSSIEESKYLSTIFIDELVGSLQAHKQRMNQYDDASHLEETLQSKVSIGENYEGRKTKVEERCHFASKKEDKDVGTTMFLTNEGDEEIKKNVWYLDTGASNHMTSHKDLFTEVDETISGEVTFGDSLKIPVKRKCIITIVSKNDEKKFGHLGFCGLKLSSKTKMVEGFPEINEPENLSEACIKGKQHRQSFPVGKLWRARRPLEIVHTNIAGSFDIPSLGRNRYYLTFIDDFSRKS
ncbi:uncharacterized protein LOC141710222 [Apium graveolens]|uniref:uncharacterized protein LOC141710222 n=1 Tax=Apium graveolens TaxID=4045 RepID=UPI003D7B7A28